MKTNKPTQSDDFGHIDEDPGYVSASVVKNEITSNDALAKAIERLAIRIKERLTLPSSTRIHYPIAICDDELNTLVGAAKHCRELQEQNSRYTGALIDAQNDITKLERHSRSATKVIEELVRALQRLWDDDEMGWIVYETTSECVKCGSKGLTALPLNHEDGCVQGYIYSALLLARQFLDGKECK